MTQPESPTPDYTISYGEGFTQVERLHTAEANAAYLLPLLRPGCLAQSSACWTSAAAPATYQVGLARAIAPGELHGVDLEEAQMNGSGPMPVRRLDWATPYSTVGDVTAIPFQDGFLRRWTQATTL